MILALFWALYVVAIFAPARFATYLFFISASFEMFAAVPLNLTGGTTLTPAVLLGPLVGIKIFLEGVSSQEIQDAMLSWRKLGLLSYFLLIGIIVTVTAPKMFPDTIVKALNDHGTAHLHFSGTNVSQLLYISSSYFIALSIFFLLSTAHGRKTLAGALLAGAGMAVLSGMLDYTTLGTSILDPVRTASYSLLTDNEVGGVTRMIGFCPEASAYGGLTLSYAAILLFMKPARILGKPWTYIEPLLIALLLGCIALSTSSGTYVGAVVLMILALVDVSFRLITTNSLEERNTVFVEFLGMALIASIVCLVVIIRSDLAKAAYDLFDTAVLQKGKSSSYEERQSWNTISWDGFLSTSGYGVGIGSTRTSNWAVAVVSSTGILGAALMIAFIARCIFTPIPHGDPRIARLAVGARYALATCVVPALGAGTLVDFGPFNALLFAAMVAVPTVMNPQAWEQRKSRLEIPGSPRARFGGGSLGRR